MNDRHTYYNALVTSSYLHTSNLSKCDELIDGNRCSFDALGNITGIDGRRIIGRNGCIFVFANNIQSKQQKG